LITTSSEPSLSRSPEAAPLEDHAVLIPGPAESERSLNFPVPTFQNNRRCWRYFAAAGRRSASRETGPVARRITLRPSFAQVQEQSSPSEELVAHAKSGGIHLIQETPVPGVVVQVRRVLAEIGFEDVEVSILVIVRHCDAHTGLFLPILIQRRARENAGLFES